MATIEILNPVSELLARPRDCALLVTVPSTREEFFHDYRTGTDFVECFIRESRAATADAGWEGYQRYASLARHVMSRVKKRGVNVIERATLAGLHGTLAAYPVTTLVAHWRSARFRTYDIVEVRRVREYLREAGLSQNARDGGDDRDDLCSALNFLLDEGSTARGAEEMMSAGALSAQQFRWYEKRDAIKASLPGAFRGGAAVEFVGGFRTMAEITYGITPFYAGILDLTVCQSVLLGEMVRRRCPKSLALTSADTTSMDFRLAAYHQVIEILALAPRPFEDVVIDVRKAIMVRYGRPEK